MLPWFLKNGACDGEASDVRESSLNRWGLIVGIYIYISDGLKVRAVCILFPTTFSSLLFGCCGLLMSYKDIHFVGNGSEVNANSIETVEVSKN